MSPSRRTEHYPLVVSTEAHAAIEAAFLAAVSPPPPASPPASPAPAPAEPNYQIPDSPAELWTSVSRAGIMVGPSDEQVPSELSAWVAPPLVVRLTSN